MQSQSETCELSQCIANSIPCITPGQRCEGVRMSPVLRLQCPLQSQVGAIATFIFQETHLGWQKDRVLPEIS